MKNVAFSRLGTMLHLEVQKGEEATMFFDFQKELIENTALMDRLTMATKGCGQLT